MTTARPNPARWSAAAWPGTLPPARVCAATGRTVEEAVADGGGQAERLSRTDPRHDTHATLLCDDVAERLPQHVVNLDVAGHSGCLASSSWCTSVRVAPASSNSVRGWC